VAQTISGAVAHVRWRYYDAATIEGFTITPAGEAWLLVGRVVQANAFNLTQRPLTFIVPIVWQGRPLDWLWPIETYAIESGVLRGVLGTPTHGVNHGGILVRSA
jgi:hypothetical protein